MSQCSCLCTIGWTVRCSICHRCPCPFSWIAAWTCEGISHALLTKSEDDLKEIIEVNFRGHVTRRGARSFLFLLSTLGPWFGSEIETFLFRFWHISFKFYIFINQFCILGFIHMLKNLVPYRMIEHSFSILDILFQPIQIRLRLQRKLLSQVGLEQLANLTFNCKLDISKLFIDFMSQNFPKNENFSIFHLIILNCFYNRFSLVKNYWFKTIFLSQISL